MIWEEPKPSGSKYQWHSISAELRANKNRWARFDELPTVYGTLIRQGRIKAMRPVGSFESKVSGGIVYARYVGGDDD